MNQFFLRLAFALFLFSSFLADTQASSIEVPATTSGASTVDPHPSAVKAAIKEFKSLSRKERKARIKEAKKTIRDYRADKKAGKAAATSMFWLVVLAILLPPVAVVLKEDGVTSHFWISLLLTLLLWLPGVIYSLVIVTSE